MDSRADPAEKTLRQSFKVLDCSETKPDVSLNMTGDSIEGYNFFTDSSYEHGRDLLCILEAACDPPELLPARSPSNQKPPSNDFINLKKKKNPQTNPKLSASSPKKKEEKTAALELRETAHSAVKRKPALIRQGGPQSSTKKQPSTKKPPTEPQLKSQLPIPLFLGMGKNPSLFTKNIQQLRSCKSNLLFAEPALLPRTESALSRNRVSCSNRERDMQQDYANLCQMVRENLKKKPPGRDGTKPTHESSNNLHRPLRDIDTNRDAPPPAHRLGPQAAKQPRRLEVFANLQHLFQAADSPGRPADRPPRDALDSTEQLCSETRFEIFDFGLKTELDKIKLNLDKMISRVSSQRTIQTAPKQEQSLERAEPFPETQAAPGPRTSQDRADSRENSLGISPSKKRLRKTMHSASQARLGCARAKEPAGGQEYFQTLSHSKKRLHLLPRASSNKLLLACASRESLHLSNTNHFLYKGSCNSTKQLLSTGSWVRGMCSIEERAESKKPAGPFSRETSKEKTARLIKLDANSIRRLSQKYLHNRERSKEPPAPITAVSKVVSKSKELLGVLKSQSSSLEKVKSSLGAPQARQIEHVLSKKKL